MTAQNFKKLLVETVGPMFEELKYGQHRLEKRITKLEKNAN
jgi:hypothetical protein